MKIQNLTLLTNSENSFSPAAPTASAVTPENTAFGFENGTREGIFQSMVRGSGRVRHPAAPGITSAAEAVIVLNRAGQLYNQARDLVESDRPRSLALTEQALTLVNQVGRFHNNTPNALTDDQRSKLNDLLTDCIALRNRLQSNG